MMDPQGHMLSFIILSKDTLERTAKMCPYLCTMSSMGIHNESTADSNLDIQISQLVPAYCMRHFGNKENFKMDPINNAVNDKIHAIHMKMSCFCFRFGHVLKQ